MKDLAKFVYEMGQLKRVSRSGWWLIGITDPESVAEHSFRTVIIGHILANLANADASKVLMMCLYHDTAETRVNDPHRVAKRYLDFQIGERQAQSEQFDRLPEDIATNLKALLEEYEERATLEAKIAHDADSLECMLQGREYETQGFSDAEDWVSGCYASLQTGAAKALADVCLNTEPSAWWRGLKKNHK